MTGSTRRLSPKSIALALAVVAVGIQVIRPARTNPPIDPAKTLQATGRVPADVSAILDRACKDCHSNATEWPWYSNVAPVSWVLVSHVNEGREHLSLSNWADYNAKDAAHKLEEICEHVKNGEMPMTSYVLAHRTAALSEDDKQVICGWTARAQAATP